MLAPAHDLRSGVALGPLLLAALGLWACTGPDHLTDPLIAADVASSLGGSPGIAAAGSSAIIGTAGTSTAVPGAGGSAFGGAASTPTGGGVASGGTQADTTSVTGFDWGNTTFDATAGATVDHQAHYNGMGCINANCHSMPSFTANAAGTVYLADGTTSASNVQIGIFIDGTLSTTYAGSQGNFWVTLPSVTGFATAQIAVRNASGTTLMPVNAAATGNCNSCHDATNRIVTQ